LQKISVSEDDPSAIFHWHEIALIQFVNNMNNMINLPPRPAWIRPIVASTDDIRQDIISHVALVAGGNFGNVLIAPNDLVQYGNVRDRITRIESDPFVQSCMTGIAPQNGLATCGVIRDRSIANATPMARVPAPPLALVFL
jgi:hypothetical protein